MDELFEMLTWNNLKIHQKQIFILNSAGFYNNLIAHFKTMHQEGFLYNNPMEEIIFINTPEEFLLYLK
jgi:predicted Rossmann-fold nucleotide-binding protein